MFGHFSHIDKDGNKNYLPYIPDAHLESCQTSKTEIFVETINSLNL